MRNSAAIETDTCREFVTPRPIQADWGTLLYTSMHLLDEIVGVVTEVQA